MPNWDMGQLRRGTGATVVPRPASYKIVKAEIEMEGGEIVGGRLARLWKAGLDVGLVVKQLARTYWRQPARH